MENACCRDFIYITEHINRITYYLPDKLTHITFGNNFDQMTNLIFGVCLIKIVTIYQKYS
jgi:hypothetical protein